MRPVAVAAAVAYVGAVPVAASIVAGASADAAAVAG